MFFSVFLTVPRVCLWPVIVAVPDHTHLFFSYKANYGHIEMNFHTGNCCLKMCNPNDILYYHTVIDQDSILHFVSEKTSIYCNMFLNSLTFVMINVSLLVIKTNLISSS